MVHHSNSTCLSIPPQITQFHFLQRTHTWHIHHMDSQTAVHHFCEAMQLDPKKTFKAELFAIRAIGRQSTDRVSISEFFPSLCVWISRVSISVQVSDSQRTVPKKKLTHKTRWILCSPPFQQLRSQVFSGYGVFMNDVWAEAVAEAQPLGLTEQQLLVKLKSRWDQMTGVVLAKKPEKICEVQRYLQM